MRKARGIIGKEEVWFVLDDNESNITMEDILYSDVTIFSRGLPVSLTFDCHEYVYFERTQLGGHLADKLIDALLMERETLIDISTL